MFDWINQWHVLGLIVYLLIGCISYLLSWRVVRKRFKGEVFFPFDIHNCLMSTALWPFLPAMKFIRKGADQNYFITRDNGKAVVSRITVIKVRDGLYHAIAEYVGYTLEAHGATELVAHANVLHKAKARFGAKGVGADTLKS